MLRRDAIALLLAAAPAPRRAVILLDVRTRRVLTARNSELLAPPGSTLKPLVFSTLLRAKKLDPGESFPCTGRLTIDGRRFDCSHPPMNRPIDLRIALAYSLEILRRVGRIGQNDNYVRDDEPPFIVVEGFSNLVAFK